MTWIASVDLRALVKVAGGIDGWQPMDDIHRLRPEIGIQLHLLMAPTSAIEGRASNKFGREREEFAMRLHTHLWLDVFTCW